MNNEQSGYSYVPYQLIGDVLIEIQDLKTTVTAILPVFFFKHHVWLLVCPAEFEPTPFCLADQHSISWANWAVVGENIYYLKTKMEANIT